MQIPEGTYNRRVLHGRPSLQEGGECPIFSRPRGGGSHREAPVSAIQRLRNVRVSGPGEIIILVVQYDGNMGTDFDM